MISSLPASGGPRAIRRRLPEDLYRSLLSESFDCRPAATRIESSLCTLEAAGSVNGRGRCRVAGPGPSLNAFHSGWGLEAAVEFAEGLGDLLPTRSAFLFYDQGDYSFLHHDNVNAHITIIVGLSGLLLPLIAFPNFGSVSESDVITLNSVEQLDSASFRRTMGFHFGARSCSEEIEISQEWATVIPGRKVPHARPMQTAPCSVCTACYAFIAPDEKWLAPTR